MGRGGQCQATQERIRVLGELFYIPTKGSRLQKWLLPIASIMIAPGDTWDDWVLLEVPGMLSGMQQCTAGHLKAAALQSGHRAMPWLCPWTVIVAAAALGEESARPPQIWGCFSH